MFPIALLAALAAGALAQSTVILDPTYTTTTIASPQSSPSQTGSPDPSRVDSGSDASKDPRPHIAAPAVGFMGDGFVGSVMKADPCSTTVVLGCAPTSKPNMYCENDDKFKATMTAGPYDYKMQYSTKHDGKKLSLSESCHIGPGDSPFSDSHWATCTLSMPFLGKQTGALGVDTVNVPITAGEKNLPTGSATCPTPTSGATPTGILEIRKVVVPLVLAAAAQALL